MILVTGASGNIGGSVARRLADSGRPVRVLVRDPRRVGVQGAGVQAVRGDFADPAGLEAAFRGVTRVFVVTNNPLEPRHDQNLLAAALRAGARHVVRLSAAAVEDPQAVDLITQWHRDCEERIAASGLDWTFIRSRAFMSNALAWVDSVRAGVVCAPFGTARGACVDPRDVAEVAVRALTEPGHEGCAYSVTGPEAISAAEQTEQLAEALGRPLRFEQVTLEQARASLALRYPLPIADALTCCARRLGAGAKHQVEPTVEKVTGRPARTFRQWAREHVAAFR